MDKFQILNYTISFIVILKNIIVYAIIARILVSWFTLGQNQPAGRIVVFLNDITDPFINLARKIPHKIGMIDLAPLIALIGLDLLVQLFVYLVSKLI